MKTKYIIGMLLMFIPLILIGAEPVTDVPDVGKDDVSGPSIDRTISLWQLLIPIAVPMLIAGLKALIPALPPRITPFIAPILGALIDVLLNLGGLGGGVGVVGAVLGTAGVGVREMQNQAVKPQKP